MLPNDQKSYVKLILVHCDKQLQSAVLIMEPFMEPLREINPNVHHLQEENP